MMISLNSTIALVLAVVVVLLLMMTTVSFVVVVNAFSSVGQLPRATRTTIPSSSSSLFKDNNNNYHHSCRSNTISTDCRRRQTLSLSLSGRATNTELSDDETACAEVDVLRQQAEQLKAKAKAIRDELDQTDTKAAASETKVAVASSTPKRSPFDLPPPTSSDAATAAEYRLSVDIGREDGTWMDPRWGSSGRRIEFTVDVRFIFTSSDNNDVDAVVSDEYKKAMVIDNFGGKSSQVRSIVSSPAAKLNRGFDSMKCHGGAYRIDLERNGKGTVRFHLCVDGYESSGDVSIPQGYLYFSIPVFNNRLTMLSQKPGPVTVRQVGWHTGWRREESRMVGTFKAVPLQQ